MNGFQCFVCFLKDIIKLRISKLDYKYFIKKEKFINCGINELE